MSFRKVIYGNRNERGDAEKDRNLQGDVTGEVLERCMDVWMKVGQADRRTPRCPPARACEKERRERIGKQTRERGKTVKAGQYDESSIDCTSLTALRELLDIDNIVVVAIAKRGWFQIWRYIWGSKRC